MEIQRNISQVQKKEKYAEKNEMKEGSLLEFKILVKKLLKELSENFNKEIVSIKKQ